MLRACCGRCCDLAATAAFRTHGGACATPARSPQRRHGACVDNLQRRGGLCDRAACVCVCVDACARVCVQVCVACVRISRRGKPISPSRALLAPALVLSPSRQTARTDPSLKDIQTTAEPPSNRGANCATQDCACDCSLLSDTEVDDEQGAARLEDPLYVLHSRFLIACRQHLVAWPGRAW